MTHIKPLYRMLHLPPISYCTNILTAESWVETLAAWRDFIPQVKQALASLATSKHTITTPRPLALGLRLSAQAADALIEHPAHLADLSALLQEHDVYVDTLNGFPYQDFHQPGLKEQVFAPDWSTPERMHYTIQLFRILAQLAHPTAHTLTVSTVPATHLSFDTNPDSIMERLDAVAGFLAKLSQEVGKDCILGLEPEPFGLLQDTNSTLAFFNNLRNRSKHPHLIEKHIGITLDTCHFAVMSEPTILMDMANAQIRVAKIQISNALALSHPTPADMALLEPWQDSVFCHQTRISQPSRPTFTPPTDVSVYFDKRVPLISDSSWVLFSDLPDAIEHVANWSPQQLSRSDWRIHYHIPLYHQPSYPFSNTMAFTHELIKQIPAYAKICHECPQLEVETYTWHVLPAHLRVQLPTQVARELSLAAALIHPVPAATVS